MTFPTAYDSDATTYGDLSDQRSVILAETIGTGDLTAVFETVVGINPPIYLRIGTEIVKVTAVNVGTNELTMTRAQLGTTATTHALGDAAYIVLVADYFNLIRDKALAMQQRQGLVGLDAAKPASPSVGEVYIATDTKKVYSCTTAGTWSLFGGVKNHSETIQVPETDDHTQYLTTARAVSWHSALTGSHVQGGDSHDHRYGTGVARVRSGLASAVPGTGTSGDVYYATDTSELSIHNGTAFVKVTGAPTGTIAVFDATDLSGACPSGWSRATLLDGKFLKGAPAGITSPLGTGGAETHSHTFSQIPAHTHNIATQNATSSSVGNHNHDFAFSTLLSGSGLASTPGTAGTTFATNSGGSHSHTASMTGFASGGAKKTSDNTDGTASGTTNSQNHVPPYQEVIFCQKN